MSIKLGEYNMYRPNIEVKAANQYLLIILFLKKIYTNGGTKIKLRDVINAERVGVVRIKPYV